MKRLSPKEQHEARRAGDKPARRAAQRAIVRKIAKENAERPYVELICGHFTYKEVMELYRAWRPAKGLEYCEKCSFWTERKPPPERPEYPEEAPF